MGTNGPSPEEIAFYDEQRERRREQMMKMASEWPILAAQAHALSQRSDRTISAAVDADYAIPAHFHKTVAPPALRELRGLLDALREFRARLVGLPELYAWTLCNGDDQALLLGAEFDTWVRKHLHERLSKPSLKDHGDPFRTFFRLEDDFVAWFERLALARGTGHRIALVRPLEHLRWELFQRTWAPLVTIDRGKRTAWIDGLSDTEQQSAVDILIAHGWCASHVARDMIAGTRDLGTVVRGSPDAHRHELSVLAADLVEMKNVLIRGYRPEEHIVDLPNGMVAAWAWTGGHRAGVVHVGGSRADVVREAASGLCTGVVDIDLGGMPREPKLPWLDLDDDAVRWTLAVLRSVHAYMLNIWMDAERHVEAVVHAEATDDIAEGEMLAAACESLADEAEPDTRLSACPPVPIPRVPAVRSITLLAMLERRFDCEVKQGKGSEITVWRPGGHKYTLGGHRRNAHVPAAIIRSLLKTVGIDIAEFCRVVAGRRVGG